MWSKASKISGNHFNSNFSLPIDKVIFWLESHFDESVKIIKQRIVFIFFLCFLELWKEKKVWVKFMNDTIHMLHPKHIRWIFQMLTSSTAKNSTPMAITMAHAYSILPILWMNHYLFSFLFMTMIIVSILVGRPVG